MCCHSPSTAGTSSSAIHSGRSSRAHRTGWQTSGERSSSHSVQSVESSPAAMRSARVWQLARSASPPHFPAKLQAWHGGEAMGSDGSRWHRRPRFPAGHTGPLPARSPEVRAPTRRRGPACARQLRPSGTRTRPTRRPPRRSGRSCVGPRPSLRGRRTGRLSRRRPGPCRWSGRPRRRRCR